MPSNAYLSAMEARTHSEVPVTCVRIEHEDLDPATWPNGILICDHHEAVTSGGLTYQPTGFAVPWPDDDPEKPAAIDFVVAADESIRIAMTQIVTPATFTIFEVQPSTPETIEQGPLSLKMGAARADNDTITAELTVEPVLVQRWPAGMMTPGTRPGMF